VMTGIAEQATQVAQDAREAVTDLASKITS
jgi:hypothetical protein